MTWLSNLDAPRFQNLRLHQRSTAGEQGKVCEVYGGVCVCVRQCVSVGELSASVRVEDSVCVYLCVFIRVCA